MYREPDGNGLKVLRVGAKTALGAGIGVLGGIFATVAATQVLEIALPAVLITKAAGFLGGATGLVKGINKESEEAEGIPLVEDLAN